MATKRSRYPLGSDRSVGGMRSWFASPLQNRRVSVTANGATVHHTARFTGLQYVRFGSNVACCGAANTSLLDDVEWYR